MSVTTAPLRNRSTDLEALLRRPLDERAARATLRRQVALLERELAALTLDLWEAGRTRRPRLDATPADRLPGGRLLSIGELENVRDDLIDQIDTARDILKQRSETQSQARAHLDAMLADPASHRFHTVPREDLGEPSCGAYQVRPRLGLLGMLFGWWCVKLSSGCPLAMYHRTNFHRRQHLSWRRSARFDLMVAVIVVLAILAAVAVFLLIYHDFPFRLGEAT